MTSPEPLPAEQRARNEPSVPAREIPSAESAPVTISLRALACHANLESFSRLLPASPYKALDNIALDELGRLKIWAANLGAFQDRSSSSSLDSRLQYAERMRSSVLSGIERLNGAILTAQDIVSGDLPNRSDLPEPTQKNLVQHTVDRVLESFKGRPKLGFGQQTYTTELVELFLNIQSSISNLFELSVLIRRDRPRGRTQRPGAQVPQTDPGPDIMHSKDKFPKLRHSPWLADKIGAGISRQRDYIRYRQSHRKKLARPSVAPERDGRSVLQSEHATTKATSFGEPPVAPPSSTEETVVGHVVEEKSIMTIATSFATTAPGELSSGRKIPELTDLWLEGVQLQYGSHFECPYCRTIQKVSNRKQWKHHVYRDLELYVCTFRECTAAPFGTSHEWFQHEMDNHRRQWKCVMCQSKCDSASSLESHFSSHHRTAISAAQRPIMVKACETAVTTFDEASCPFCNDWRPPKSEDNHSNKFRSHLEKHLQELAREALPLAIDGLEIREYEDDRSLYCSACMNIWARTENPVVCPRCGRASTVTVVDDAKSEDSMSEADEDHKTDKTSGQKNYEQEEEEFVLLRIGLRDMSRRAESLICLGLPLTQTGSYCLELFVSDTSHVNHYQSVHADRLRGPYYTTMVCSECSVDVNIPGSCPRCRRTELAYPESWIWGWVPSPVAAKFMLISGQWRHIFGDKPIFRSSKELREDPFGGVEVDSWRTTARPLINTVLDFHCPFPDCTTESRSKQEVVQHLSDSHDFDQLKSSWSRFYKSLGRNGPAMPSAGVEWLSEQVWSKIPMELQTIIQSHDWPEDTEEPSTTRLPGISEMEESKEWNNQFNNPPEQQHPGSSRRTVMDTQDKPWDLLEEWNTSDENEMINAPRPEEHLDQTRPETVPQPRKPSQTSSTHPGPPMEGSSVENSKKGKNTSRLSETEAHTPVFDPWDTRQFQETSQSREERGLASAPAKSKSEDGDSDRLSIIANVGGIKTGGNKDWSGSILTAENLLAHDRKSPHGNLYHDMMGFLDNTSIPKSPDIDPELLASVGDGADERFPRASENIDPDDHVVTRNQSPLQRHSRTQGHDLMATVEDGNEEAEEVANRGDPEQFPILVEQVDEFNPERRFVVVPTRERDADVQSIRSTVAEVETDAITGQWSGHKFPD